MKDKKDKRIEVKLSKKHYDDIATKSEKVQMTMSEYLLFCGMNAQIRCNVGNTMDSLNFEISTAYKMMKDGIISDQEFSRMKNHFIEKNEKTSG